MKATLIKKLDNGWPVYSLRRADGKMIATTRFPFDEPALMIAKNAGIELQKLSHVKCDEIFGIPDADALAKQFAIDEGYDSSVGDLYKGYYYGFNKALKLNETKVFTMKDMVDCWNTALKFQENELTLGEFIQSLRPTEIEVEVEMEVADLAFYENGERYPIEADLPERFKYKSKLDSEGCLILKKI